MYNEEAIILLQKRIAWDKNVPGDTPVINDDNLTGESGMTFSRFHQLAIPSNIYATSEIVNASDLVFNDELSSLRKQAVLSVLSNVFSQNKAYLESSDYSDKISKRVSIFDEAIGFTLACSVLEKFISSSRSNIEERNAKMAMNNLKLELEGYKNENGYTVAKGLRWFRDQAIQNAIEYFFPEPIVIKSPPNFW